MSNPGENLLCARIGGEPAKLFESRHQCLFGKPERLAASEAYQPGRRRHQAISREEKGRVSALVKRAGPALESLLMARPSA